MLKEENYVEIKKIEMHISFWYMDENLSFMCVCVCVCYIDILNTSIQQIDLGLRIDLGTNTFRIIKGMIFWMIFWSDRRRICNGF